MILLAICIIVVFIIAGFAAWIDSDKYIDWEE